MTTLRGGAAAILVLALALAACSGDAGGAPDAAAELPITFGGDRPVTLQVPIDYDGATPFPLLLLLHGYGANGFIQQAYLGFANAADARGVLIAAPDGAVDGLGKQYWNASDACCANDGRDVDDVAYLGGLLDEIVATYNVDPARVFVIGHSNGGFMSFRLACERPDRVVAIMSLAGGAAFADPTACVPDRPVSVLDIHGDADVVVGYAGGIMNGATYPGARDSIARWAGYDGCTGELSGGAPLDLEEVVIGDETTAEVVTGCPEGVALELWTGHGVGHLPALAQPDFADAVWTWLGDHAR